MMVLSKSKYVGTALLQDVLAHDSQTRLKALRELKNLLARQHNIVSTLLLGIETVSSNRCMVY